MKIFNLIRCSQIQNNFKTAQNCSESAKTEWRRSFLEAAAASLRFLGLFWGKLTRPASITASNLASGLNTSKKTTPFCSFHGHDIHNLHASGIFFIWTYKKMLKVKKSCIMMDYHLVISDLTSKILHSILVFTYIFLRIYNQYYDIKLF